MSWRDEKNLSRVERVVRFAESLPVTSGTLAGQNFKVRPFQHKIIEGIYRVNEEGRRPVRQALITMPRKNGKTGLTAVLALCHFIGPESVPRGQVYSAAAERKQSGLLYEEMKAIILKVPWMRNRVIIRDFTKQLEDVETGTVFFALSAEASTKHGYSASCWIYDEIAQARDRKLYDVLSTSTGAHDEPLGIVISTQSADPNHIMSELVDYGLQIAEGILPEDESFYAYIAAAPVNADPWSEETWFTCNPALGDFRSLQEMRDSAKQAQRIPARQATFRLLYLNQRVSAAARFIPQAIWDQCADKIDLERLKGRSCYGGLDLSAGKNDLTALALMFPFDDGSKIVLPYFWQAEDELEEAENRDRVPYRLWVDQGYLSATPGAVIDYEIIARKIAELQSLYDIQTIAFDPWAIKFLIKEMEKLGMDIVLQPVAQNFHDMSPSIRGLEDMILRRELRHPNNPILNWNLDNVRVTMDPAGNRKFDKTKTTGRIDGMVALAMAAGIVAAPAESEPQFFVFGGEYANTTSR